MIVGFQCGILKCNKNLLNLYVQIFNYLMILRFCEFALKSKYSNVIQIQVKDIRAHRKLFSLVVIKQIVASIFQLL